MSLRARCSVVCSLLAAVIAIPTFVLAQGTNGRILGRVSDPSGAVLAGVNVTLVNEDTSAKRDSKTNDSGDYDFVEVPVGKYRLEFDRSGFKKNIRRGVGLDINQVITLNMTMQVGGAQEVVDVTSEAPLVETTSTQLGAVVGDRAVSELPLNARDTYQFLQLQPGVMSTAGSSNSIVYGRENPGAVSVNGGRGRSNNFSVNGGDANDQFVNLPTVQPTPDSIQEFRVLTNTFDAEYGRNSGSVVNVVTKSGTNGFHGDVYEFFRNKVLNARGYFDTERPKFNQNQFGGTVGGPIRKDHTFFFTSYEGRRIRQGMPSPTVPVPTALQRPDPNNPTISDGVSGIVANYSDGTPFSGALSDTYPLQQRPGCATAIQNLSGITLPQGQTGTPVNYAGTYDNQGNLVAPGIFTDVADGLDNIIPLECMDPTAVNLLQFVPLPNLSSGLLQTVPVQPERGDQFTVKIDHRINDKQNLSIYYYFDDHHLISPFAQFQAAGANVPGFASITAERFQQWNISHTWTINNSTVNEFRFNYNREAQRTFQHPQRTSKVQDACPTPLSWLTTALNTSSIPCFDDGTQGNPTGIHPGLGSQREGLPFIQLSGGFTIGNNGEGELPQVGNSFQWSDSISKVMGKHSFKFGGDVRRQRFDQTLYFDVSGEFFFSGSGTNSTLGDTVFPDYLLGLPDSFGEGSAQVENVRSTATYLFAQDSWKLKPNLTLNYGLRWELTTPITDIGHHVQTFRPGQADTVFSCQLQGLPGGLPNPLIATYGSTDCSPTGPANAVFPLGLVIPGDKGVPNGMTQTYYKAFAPRIGIAWSPGTSGKTSIRAGFGMFYNPIEQLVLEQFSAEPPFGGSSFPATTLFNQPFLSQDGLTQYPNPFNGILNPARGSQVDWSQFRPILLFGQFQPKMRSQYSDQYNLTIQHQLRPDLKLEIGYVGSQGHRLLATHDLNYGNPQTCLDLNDIPESGGCGQYFADSSFFVPAGATTGPNGLLLPYGPNGPTLIPANTTLTNDITLVGLRQYSSPLCDPMSGNGCPADGVPVFSSIFAQDTIANSAYNSLQASLDKRFAHGLQFTAAYTFSKSFDEASSFEGIVNPIDQRLSRSLSTFDARHRIVLSYYWELPFHKYSGARGQLLNGWALSGITTFQTGFPIRITSQADNELMYSFDFELPGEPLQLAPFHTNDPHHTGCAYETGPTEPAAVVALNNGPTPCSPVTNQYFDPNTFSENAGAFPQIFGAIPRTKRTICCGPHISNTDFALLKTFKISETQRFDFRAEFFNIFNHTQFFNPDGGSSDGSQFGQITEARAPRLVQFALKFFF